MAQTIRYMSGAVMVKAAADNNAATSQPSQGSVPAVSPSHAGDVVEALSDITLAAATDPLATNDIYVGLPVPLGMQVLNARIISGDIDTGASLTMTVAQLAKDFTDIVAGTELIIASTVGQAGGVASAANAAGLMVAPDYTQDRWFGIKVAAGAAGLNAGATLRLALSYQSPII